MAIGHIGFNRIIPWPLTILTQCISLLLSRNITSIINYHPLFHVDGKNILLSHAGKDEGISVVFRYFHFYCALIALKSATCSNIALSHRRGIDPGYRSRTPATHSPDATALYIPLHIRHWPRSFPGCPKERIIGIDGICILLQ